MKKILTLAALFIIGLIFVADKEEDGPLINIASADVPSTPELIDNDGSDTGSTDAGDAGDADM